MSEKEIKNNIDDDTLALISRLRKVVCQVGKVMPLTKKLIYREKALRKLNEFYENPNPINVQEYYLHMILNSLSISNIEILNIAMASKTPVILATDHMPIDYNPSFSSIIHFHWHRILKTVREFMGKNSANGGSSRHQNSANDNILRNSINSYGQIRVCGGGSSDDSCQSQTHQQEIGSYQNQKDISGSLELVNRGFGESSQNFFISYDLTTNYTIVPPYTNKTLNAVIFNPSFGDIEGSLIVKSNLTSISVIPLFGRGNVGGLELIAVYKIDEYRTQQSPAGSSKENPDIKQEKGRQQSQDEEISIETIDFVIQDSQMNNSFINKIFATRQVVFKNTGAMDLLIKKVVIGNSEASNNGFSFLIDQRGFILQPGVEKEILITYSSDHVFLNLSKKIYFYTQSYRFQFDMIIDYSQITNFREYIPMVTLNQKWAFLIFLVLYQLVNFVIMLIYNGSPVNKKKEKRMQRSHYKLKEDQNSNELGDRVELKHIIKKSRPSEILDFLKNEPKNNNIYQEQKENYNHQNHNQYENPEYFNQTHNYREIEPENYGGENITYEELEEHFRNIQKQNEDYHENEINQNIQSQNKQKDQSKNKSKNQVQPIHSLNQINQNQDEKDQQHFQLVDEHQNTNNGDHINHEQLFQHQSEYNHEEQHEKFEDQEDQPKSGNKIKNQGNLNQQINSTNGKTGQDTDRTDQSDQTDRTEKSNSSNTHDINSNNINNNNTNTNNTGKNSHSIGQIKDGNSKTNEISQIQQPSFSIDLTQIKGNFEAHFPQLPTTSNDQQTNNPHEFYGKELKDNQKEQNPNDNSNSKNTNNQKDNISDTNQNETPDQVHQKQIVNNREQTTDNNMGDTNQTLVGSQNIDDTQQLNQYQNNSQQISNSNNLNNNNISNNQTSTSLPLPFNPDFLPKNPAKFIPNYCNLLNPNNPAYDKETALAVKHFITHGQFPSSISAEMAEQIHNKFFKNAPSNLNDKRQKEQPDTLKIYQRKNNYNSSNKDQTDESGDASGRNYDQYHTGPSSNTYGGSYNRNSTRGSYNYYQNKNIRGEDSFQQGKYFGKGGNPAYRPKDNDDSSIDGQSDYQEEDDNYENSQSFHSSGDEIDNDSENSNNSSPNNKLYYNKYNDNTRKLKQNEQSNESSDVDDSHNGSNRREGPKSYIKNSYNSQQGVGSTTQGISTTYPKNYQTAGGLPFNSKFTSGQYIQAGGSTGAQRTSNRKYNTDKHYDYNTRNRVYPNKDEQYATVEYDDVSVIYQVQNQPIKGTNFNQIQYDGSQKDQYSQSAGSGNRFTNSNASKKYPYGKPIKDYGNSNYNQSGSSFYRNNQSNYNNLGVKSNENQIQNESFSSSRNDSNNNETPQQNDIYKNNGLNTNNNGGMNQEDNYSRNQNQNSPGTVQDDHSHDKSRSSDSELSRGESLSDKDLRKLVENVIDDDDDIDEGEAAKQWQKYNNNTRIQDHPDDWNEDERNNSKGFIQKGQKYLMDDQINSSKGKTGQMETYNLFSRKTNSPSQKLIIPYQIFPKNEDSYKEKEHSLFDQVNRAKIHSSSGYQQQQGTDEFSQTSSDNLKDDSEHQFHSKQLSKQSLQKSSVPFNQPGPRSSGSSGNAIYGPDSTNMTQPQYLKPTHLTQFPNPTGINMPIHHQPQPQQMTSGNSNNDYRYETTYSRNISFLGIGSQNTGYNMGMHSSGQPTSSQQQASFDSDSESSNSSDSYNPYLNQLKSNPNVRNANYYPSDNKPTIMPSTNTYGSQSTMLNSGYYNSGLMSQQPHIPSSSSGQYVATSSKPMSLMPNNPLNIMQLMSSNSNFPHLMQNNMYSGQRPNTGQMNTLSSNSNPNSLHSSEGQNYYNNSGPGIGGFKQTQTSSKTPPPGMDINQPFGSK